MDFDLKELIERSLAEDLGPGDVTSATTIPAESVSTAVILVKQHCILAGLAVSKEVFRSIDREVHFEMFAADGEIVHSGTEVAKLVGNTRALLAAERTALNLLQHLSGIATLTARYVAKVKGTRAAVLDTRKTLPGMRKLEKYAVRMGGGRNHRFGLSDGVLIKDNHIKAAGGITKAVGLARAGVSHLLKIQVETKSLDEVHEALAASADVIMLDNMPIDVMRQAVKVVNGKALVEASGNVTLETIHSIAETGVDLISSGSLTHSAPAIDISMKIK